MEKAEDFRGGAGAGHDLVPGSAADWRRRRLFPQNGRWLAAGGGGLTSSEVEQTPPPSQLPSQFQPRLKGLTSWDPGAGRRQGPVGTTEDEVRRGSWRGWAECSGLCRPGAGCAWRSPAGLGCRLGVELCLLLLAPRGLPWNRPPPPPHAPVPTPFRALPWRVRERRWWALGPPTRASPPSKGGQPAWLQNFWVGKGRDAVRISFCFLFLAGKRVHLQSKILVLKLQS